MVTTKEIKNSPLNVALAEMTSSRREGDDAASTSTTDSDLVLRDYRGELPIFFESEVKVEQILGKGSFCMVWTIKQVQLRKTHTLPNPLGRQRLADRMNAGSTKHKDPSLAIYGKPDKQAVDPTAPPRCVVKRLRTDIYCHFDDMSRAQEDLKAELEILLKVGTGVHPNIIELYGIGISAEEPPRRSDDTNDDENDDNDKPQSISIGPTFLILSRIRSTLEQLLCRWRDQRGLGIAAAFGWSQSSTRNLWLERMILLSRLTDAIQFLHSKQIIFRDLKPENIGVDDNGIAKLFDFGLAKDLNSLEKDEHGTYRLTGSTGTLRYMPPEVALCKPYGYGVDVYCLAITMHQVLSLKSPFANIPSKLFHDLVFEKGVRPLLESSWPQALRDLMERMWTVDPIERPSAEDVATQLSEMLRGSDDELFPASYFSW